MKYTVYKFYNHKKCNSNYLENNYNKREVDLFVRILKELRKLHIKLLY